MTQKPNNAIDWLIKNDHSQIQGPYNYQQIKNKIQLGEYTENNLVSNALDLKWKTLGSAREFHEIFLQLSLKNSVKKSTPKPEDETLINSLTNELSNTNDLPKEKDKTKVKPITPNKSTFQKPLRLNTNAQNTKRKIKKYKPKKVIIPLESKKKLVNQNKRTAIFLFLATGIGFLLYSILFPPMPKASLSLLHLKAPNFSIKIPHSKQEFKNLSTLSRQAFQKDSFVGYLQAQNYLIQAIQMKPRKKNLYELLCLTYLELWPHTYRSFKDEETFFKVFKKIRQFDLGGVSSTTCSVARLISKNLYLEAGKQISATLDSINKAEFSLYYLKALSLFHFKKYEESLDYLSSAQQLWPSWVKIAILKAQAFEGQSKYAQAIPVYQNILKKNPSHKLALIKLGIIEYKVFSHYKKSKNLLDRAIQIFNNVDFSTLSEAYLTLYKLAMHNSNKKKALSFIKQAYIFNPADKAIKALYSNMGAIPNLKHSGIKVYQLILRGDQFYQNKQYNLAQTYYKSAFSQDENNVTATYKIAQTSWELGFAKEAIAWLEKTIKIKPNFIHAYILLSQYYIHRHEYTTAARILKSAHKQNPRAYEIYRAYANLEFKRANINESISFAQKALKLYPTDKESLVLLAKSYFTQNKINTALKISEQILELHPYYNPAQEVYLHSLSEVRGIEAALVYINTLIENYPRSSFYYFLKGEVLAGYNRYFQAKKAFYKAIKINPHFKKAYLELAKVNIQDQQFQEAEDLLITAALANPSDPESLFALARLYLKRKKYKKAIKKFFSILSINKHYPLVNFYIGKTYFLTTNFKFAKQYLTQEKTNNPNLADPNLLLAEIYIKEKNYLACIQEYQHAIKIRKASAQIYIKIAKCYRLMSSLDTAKIMLDRARRIESGLPDVYKEMGAIYEASGETNLAHQAYSQYFLLKPNAEDRQKIKKRLGM